jgi:hypothetical protein
MRLITANSGSAPAPLCGLQPPRASGLVGLLLNGRASERDAVWAALKLAGGRSREVVVLLPVPRVFSHTAQQAGIDPEQLRLRAQMEQRRTVRELFAAAGGKGEYSVAAVARPLIKSVPSVAGREGCGSIVVAPGFPGSSLWCLAGRMRLTRGPRRKTMLRRMQWS